MMRGTSAAVVAPVDESAPDDRVTAPRPVTYRGANQLTRTTAALAVNTVMTSAFGLAFWLVVSHRYTARQVGTDSALLSSMLLLSSLTELNFSTALPRLLPQVRRNRHRVVALCFLATGAAGAVVATAFAFLVPHVVVNLRFLLQSKELALAFIVGLVLFNLFAVQDAVLVATRRASTVPVKNTLFGLAKLGLVLVLVGRLAGHGIFAAWLLATLLVALVVGVLLFATDECRSASDVGQQTLLPLDGRRRLVRYLTLDWLAGLLGQGTADLLPLIVLAALGRAVTGYFYIAFVVTTAVATFSQSFSVSLLVEGAHDESALEELTRRTLVRYGAVVLPALLVAVVVAPSGLRVFGTQYAVQAGTVFRLFLLATIPQTAVAVAMSVERVRGRADRVLRFQAATAVTALVLVVPLVREAGLAGVGLAWLAAQAVTFLLVLPTLVGVLSSQRQTAGQTVSNP